LDALPIQDEHVRKLCGTGATDISARRQGEVILRESEVKHRSLFENMQEAVAVYKALNNGEDFVPTDFNEAAEQSTEPFGKGVRPGPVLSQICVTG
jgi:PAS domain-containing protein